MFSKMHSIIFEFSQYSIMARLKLTLKCTAVLSYFQFGVVCRWVFIIIPTSIHHQNIGLVASNLQLTILPYSFQHGVAFKILLKIECKRPYFNPVSPNRTGLLAARVSQYCRFALFLYENVCWVAMKSSFESKAFQIPFAADENPMQPVSLRGHYISLERREGEGERKTEKKCFRFAIKEQWDF